MLSIQQSTPRGKSMLRSIQRGNQLSVFLKQSQLTTVGLSILASSWFPKLPGTAEKHTANHSPAQTLYYLLRFYLFWVSKKSKESNQTMLDNIAVSNWPINGTHAGKYFLFIWCSFGCTCGMAKKVKWLFTVASCQLHKVLYSSKCVPFYCLLKLSALNFFIFTHNKGTFYWEKNQQKLSGNADK